MRENKMKNSRRLDKIFSRKNTTYTLVAQYNQNSSMYEIPSSMDHTSEAQPIDQVSNIRTFLQSCVQLLKDPSSLKILQNLLER
jgi:hypothetical protein